MRPIDGVVTKLREKDMDILLKSGTKIRVPRENKFKLGSRVKVHYDFTRMKVNSVVLDGELFPGEELIDPGEEEDDCSDTEYNLLSNYDALIICS